MKKYYLFYAIACIIGVLAALSVLIGTIVLGILNMYVVTKIIYIILLWISLIPTAVMIFLLITVAENCAEIDELKNEIKEIKTKLAIPTSDNQSVKSYCTKCGKPVLEIDAGLCQNCGHIQDETSTELSDCPACSKIIVAPKDRFCKSCGCNLETKS